MAAVSWLSVALLACAVLAVVGAEWPRLSERLGLEARRKRQRARRKSKLQLVRGEAQDLDAEDFAASVERDLEQLPTTTVDESDRYKR
jgi:hypothetical protein